MAKGSSSNKTQAAQKPVGTKVVTGSTSSMRFGPTKKPKTKGDGTRVSN